MGLNANIIDEIHFIINKFDEIRLKTKIIDEMHKF